MNYFRPQNLSDALEWLNNNSAIIAGGCTDLFPATTRPQLSGALLDITAIDDLKGISETDTHWRFGAATTWSDIIRAELPIAFDGLKLAAREIGSVQIQNSATLVGNICNASPAADGVPCLQTLDALVEISCHTGVRIVPLSEYILGPRKIDLHAHELVSAVLIPKASAQGNSHFIKLGSRKYLVISIVMVAGRLKIDNGIIEDIALSVGACSPVAVRLRDVETALKGQRVNADLVSSITEEMVAGALSPIEDIRAGIDYRQTSAFELVRRCVGHLVATQ